MIHLTQYETHEGQILTLAVEAVNCPDPETDLIELISEGCTIRDDKVHFFRMWTNPESRHAYDAKRKAEVLSELLCVGIVTKTEVVTVAEFEG